MTFYSLQDNQCEGRIMAICRNSTKDQLDEMVEEKIEYHSIDDNEADDINFRKMFEGDIESMKNKIEAKISCLMDFGFSIVKHDTVFTEDEDGECDNYPENVMTFDEAVKEFS